MSDATEQRDLALMAARTVLQDARDAGRTTLLPDEEIAYRRHMANMRAAHAAITTT